MTHTATPAPGGQPTPPGGQAAASTRQAPQPTVGAGRGRHRTPTPTRAPGEPAGQAGPVSAHRCGDPQAVRLAMTATTVVAVAAISAMAVAAGRRTG